MSFDTEALRSDTPGCAHVAHFNHAGAALPPRPVLDAVVQHLELEATIGGYEAAAREAERLEGFYAAAATAIGAQPGEIAWMDSASRAWSTAVRSVAFQPGDRVLIAPSEYGNNVLALDRVARREDVQVDVVLIDDLPGALDERVRLVALVQVAAQLGEAQPVAEVGQLAHDAGALFLVDAAQSLGQMPVDVTQLHCDFLAATGRKWLRGPRGTGFLYVAGGVLDRLDPPVADNVYGSRADARRFELGEQSMAAKLGLAAALEYALDLGIDAIAAEVTARAARLRDELATIPGLTLREATPDTGIVTFTVDRLDSLEVVTELRDRRINLAAIPPSFAPHALTEPVLRASPHYLTTQTEIRAVANALRGDV